MIEVGTNSIGLSLKKKERKKKKQTLLISKTAGNKKLYPSAIDYTLANGLRILAEKDRSSRSVSIGIWVKVGSRDDPDGVPGLAHLLEHLTFRGTTKRDAAQISREIDSIGGHLNAGTSKEYTVYYVTVPVQGFEVALDVIGDLVQNPLFDPDDIKRERGVVTEEIRGHKDDPDLNAYDKFLRRFWNEDHPISRPTIGEAQAIQQVSRDTIVEFHQRCYCPENMVLSVCGAIEHDRLIEIVEETFTKESVDCQFPSEFRTPPTTIFGNSCCEQPTVLSRIYFGFCGMKASDKSRFALELANTVLGGGPSSRLFRVIREELGLAYDVSSSAMLYSDAGGWIIYAGVMPDNMSTVVKAIVEQLASLRQNGITHRELSLAKAKVRGNLILNQESASNRMVRLGTAVMMGQEILSLDELIDCIDEVDLTHIQRIMEILLAEDRQNITVIGPNVEDSLAGNSKNKETP